MIDTDLARRNEPSAATLEPVISVVAPVYNEGPDDPALLRASDPGVGAARRAI
jgi:hypothetical protein